MQYDFIIRCLFVTRYFYCRFFYLLSNTMCDYNVAYNK